LLDPIEINFRNWEKPATIHARDATGGYMLDGFSASKDALRSADAASDANIVGV
jgi:hypothetical protein